MNILKYILIIILFSLKTWAWVTPSLESQLEKSNGTGIYEEMSIIEPQIYLSAVDEEGDEDGALKFRIVYDGVIYDMQTRKPVVDECNVTRYEGFLASNNLKKDEKKIAMEYDVSSDIPTEALAKMNLVHGDIVVIPMDSLKDFIKDCE